MTDYVQYHNPLKNPPLEPQPDYFGIYTRKPVGSVKHGDRVWVVTSSRKPRRYQVVEWFRVSEIEENMPTDENIVSGNEGAFFRSPLRIDDQPWFADFLKNQGNFGRGFSPITERRFIRGLETAARLPGPAAQAPRR